MRKLVAWDNTNYPFRIEVLYIFFSNRAWPAIYQLRSELTCVDSSQTVRMERWARWQIDINLL